MKKIIILVVVLGMVFFGCGDNKKTKAVKIVGMRVVETIQKEQVAEKALESLVVSAETSTETSTTITSFYSGTPVIGRQYTGTDSYYNIRCSVQLTYPILIKNIGTETLTGMDDYNSNYTILYSDNILDENEQSLTKANEFPYMLGIGGTDIAPGQTLEVMNGENLILSGACPVGKQVHMKVHIYLHNMFDGFLPLQGTINRTEWDTFVNDNPPDSTGIMYFTIQ